MRKKVVLFLMITAVCSLVLFLAGCGSRSNESDHETRTLEKYVEGDPEIKTKLEKTLEDQANDLTKYSVEFEENCMVVTGTLSIKYSEYDIATTEKTFEAISQQNADPQLEMIEELTDLSGVTVKYVFIDAEGTELFNKEYNKSE